MDQTFTINLFSYTKTLVPIYRFRAITFFMVPSFFGEKWPFCPKIKKTLSWAVFREVLIVAPPVLDMCLVIYGSWINQKKSYDWDIILENIALFANTFFKYKFLVMDYVGSSNECAVFCVHGFVEINTWQVLKCTYLGWCSAHNLLKYTHGTVILGGHASAEPVSSSFRGNPYLITRLYSLKYKVTCVVHVSRAWISHYILFFAIFFFPFLYILNKYSF